MPKTKINYQNTIIYKIVCNDLTVKDLYIGCTTDFKRRKSEHKNWCNAPLKGLYECIYNNGGWSNWSMIEIEKYPCNDGNEARKKERYWVEELKATLNNNKPILTTTERENYLINRKIEKEDIFENFDVLQWFNEHHIKTDNSKDTIKLKDIYENFEGKKMIPYKTFSKKLETLTTLNKDKARQINFYRKI